MTRKKSNLPRYRSSWGQWRYIIDPEPLYFGGALHYVNKEGKFVHAKSKELFEDIKHKVITRFEFNKMFGHLLKDKSYMKFIKKLAARSL